MSDDIFLDFAGFHYQNNNKVGVFFITMLEKGEKNNIQHFFHFLQIFSIN